MSDTEIKLKLWRGDQIGAERLAATVLHIDGFSAVDPQCPLGGPDGLKDVLCEKNGWKYVAAAYFPTSDQKFKAVQDKFLHDLDGVSKNSAQGIVFLTNQAVTPIERDTLTDLATNKGHKSIIYHLERIRALLDNPSGYGARLEFLDIDMSREEQLSFFSQWNRAFADQLQEHGLMIIREISKKIDSLAGSTEQFGQNVRELTAAAQRTISLLAVTAAQSDKKHNIDLATLRVATNELTVSELCMLHRALLFDAPQGTQVGELRSTKVWIGGPGATLVTATYIPPEPALVAGMLEQLLAQWRESFPATAAKTTPEKVSAITQFHHQFLKIHPFLDGNGRIARFLLSQQASELLHQNRRIVIEDRRPYFDALAEADRGELSALETLITQAIYGVEFVSGSPCEMSGQQCPSCKTGILDVDSSGSGVACKDCGLFIPAIAP
ncbi:MAG: Fic family protein [Acidithiobacillus sp.]